MVRPSSLQASYRSSVCAIRSAAERKACMLPYLVQARPGFGAGAQQRVCHACERIGRPGAIGCTSIRSRDSFTQARHWPVLPCVALLEPTAEKPLQRARTRQAALWCRCRSLQSNNTSPLAYSCISTPSASQCRPWRTMQGFKKRGAVHDREQTAAHAYHTAGTNSTEASDQHQEVSFKKRVRRSGRRSWLPMDERCTNA